MPGVFVDVVHQCTCIEITWTMKHAHKFCVVKKPTKSQWNILKVTINFMNTLLTLFIVSPKFVWIRFNILFFCELLSPKSQIFC